MANRFAEKRQIVQLTMEPGASVAEVARSCELNANQVCKWRRAYEKGELIEPCAALLPVSVSSATGPEIAAATSGSEAVSGCGRDPRRVTRQGDYQR